MNYLAHFHLAEHNYDSIVGNFIADFIKGPVSEEIPSGIRKGIWMHRKIDVYTDAHTTVKTASKIIDAKFGKFRGIMIDIYYDHFLATRFEEFSDQSLEDFSKFVFQAFSHNWQQLPEKVRNLAPYMIKMNWLTGYREIINIDNALRRLNHRSKRAPDFTDGIEELKRNYNQLEKSFLEFYPDLLNYASVLSREKFE